MELFELLTTIEKKNVGNIYFEGIEISELNEFILEHNISYSTLDEFDNDINKIKEDILSQSDEDDKEYIEKDLNEIIEKYGHILNNEVYVQNFEINNNKVDIRLS